MTHPLMAYLDTPAQPQQQAEQGGAYKFQGEVAVGYDAKRESQPKWVVEQKIITDWLSELPPGTSVLDCPVGTGRFLKTFVEKQLPFTGLDVSGDMLVQSALKLLPEDKVAAWVKACNTKNELIPLRIEGKGVLAPADIRQTGAPDKAVDVAVNCRITRWMMGNHGPDGIRAMLKEMQRVARKQIILTARVRDHKFAVTEELIESALQGWKISRNVAGFELNYRVMMLEPA